MCGQRSLEPEAQVFETIDDLSVVVKSSVQRTCAAYGSPSACFFVEFSFLECLGLELS